MSKIVPINDVLLSCKGSFEKQNNFALKFETECLFAKQQLMKSDFTKKVAQNNQNSLKAAILNVAAIGISLNPATAHAYLVPRDGAICLDISYKGLVKLATDAGAIEWAKAVLVYEGDTFKWRGPAEPPIHEADVFDKDRINASDPLENLKGGYCLAKLTGGGYMVDVMTADEILEVRNSSKAYQAGKNCPWRGPWAGEMAKKTLVKRASKSWPQGSDRDRFDNAVEVLNQHEGLRLEHEAVDEETVVRFMDIVAKGDGLALLAFKKAEGEDVYTEAFNAAPKGEKTKLKERVRQLESEAQATLDDYVTQMGEMLESGDDGALQLDEELDETERELVYARLTDIQHRQLEQLKQDNAA